MIEIKFEVLPPLIDLGNVVATSESHATYFRMTGNRISICSLPLSQRVVFIKDRSRRGQVRWSAQPPVSVECDLRKDWLLRVSPHKFLFVSSKAAPKPSSMNIDVFEISSFKVRTPRADASSSPSMCIVLFHMVIKYARKCSDRTNERKKKPKKLPPPASNVTQGYIPPTPGFLSNAFEPLSIRSFRFNS